MKILSLKARYIIFFSAALISSFVLLTLLSVHDIILTSTSIFANEGTPIVQKAAKLINPTQFKQLTINPVESREYEQMRLALYELKQNINCRYLYTMAPKTDTTFVYIIDGSCDPSDTDNFSPIGSVEDISSYGQAPLTCMKTKTIQFSKLEKQEEWGWMISVFAPIIDSSGTAIGFTAADFDASSIVETLKQRILFSSLFSLILLIFVMILTYIFTSGLFKKINTVATSITEIATGKGDLSQKIPVKVMDEIGSLGNSCNALTSSLANMIDSIRKSVTSLSQTGTELETQTSNTIESVGAAQFAMIKITERATKQNEHMQSVHENSQKMGEAVTLLGEKLSAQAQAINQSSAAIEEITANIQHIDDNVEHIAKSYELLVHDTESGRKDQKTVTDTIKSIEDLSADLVKANTVIDDIAAQTNLLAMNAAIEAAHAGESGKGFAVVATEIRTLAENSAKQSASITKLVQSINETIHDTVKASGQSDASFKNISAKVESIRQMLDEVKMGMDEERQGAQEVLNSMTIINSTTATIKSASAVMTEQSKGVVQGIEDLRTSISDVKELAESANESIKQIAGDAQKSSIAAKENQQTAATVLDMVTNYKTGN
ncbi:MAG: hypothetical protein K6E51_03895 [Treponema sp.]|nr:hypothetical protein [Treponema sp.]